MTLVERARAFASEKHRGQVRKYTGEPYETHPQAVAAILASLGFGEEVVAAAELHDTVEDTDANLDEIESLFGHRVRQLVCQVTDVSIGHPGNRAVRKAMDREHRSKADADGQSITLADLIHNFVSITAHDDHFAPVFVEEKSQLLDVLPLAHPELRRSALHLVVSYQERRLPRDRTGGRIAG